MIERVTDLLDSWDASFVWPAVLLTLIVVPVLLVLYVVHARRRRRAAAVFANPALMPNLVAHAPGWRRHVAPVLMLLALAALLVGAARPQHATETPKREATVILVIDSSRSMSATDVKPTRLAAAQAAARRLVDELPPGSRVGVVSFAREVAVLSAPTDDLDVTKSALDALEIRGGTAVGDAIVAALGLVPDEATGEDGKPTATIVLLTDGASTEGKVGPLAAARQAKAAGVPVNTVSLGTAAGVVTDPGTGQTIAVPPDPASLAAIAKAAGGRTYQATNAAQLSEVYEGIGHRVGFEVQKQDLSFAFVAAGGLLVLLASAASLGWFRELA